MHCANPECGRAAHDLTSGVLRLIELDVPPDQRITRSDSGFPICVARSRYFWLCEQCCEVLRIRSWIDSGLVFEYRSSSPSTKETAQEFGFPVAGAVHGPQLVARRRA
jgi:hypothetical protein